MVNKIKIPSIIIAITIFSNFTIYGCRSTLKSGVTKKSTTAVIEEAVESKVKRTTKLRVRQISESNVSPRSLSLNSLPNQKNVATKTIQRYRVKFPGKSQPVLLNREELSDFIAREKKFKDITGENYLKYKLELTEKIIKENKDKIYQAKDKYKYLTEELDNNLPQKLKLKNDITLYQNLYEEVKKYDASKLSTIIYQELNDTLTQRIGNADHSHKTLINASLQLVADEVADKFFIASFISNSLDAKVKKLINENYAQADNSSIQEYFFLRDEKRVVNKSFSASINKELTEDLTKYLNKELIKEGELWSSRGFQVRRGILIGTGTAVSIKVIDHIVNDYRKVKNDLNSDR